MIKKMLKELDRVKPKTGYNVVGIDDYEEIGDDLFVIKNYELLSDAKKHAAKNKNFFVVNSEEKQ